MKTKKHWSCELNKLDACQEAVAWAQGQDSFAAAWRDCKRGDWMLWLVGKLSGRPGSVKRKKLVLAACECARLALQHAPKDELRPLKAIETAEAWARGENSVTLDQVHAAAYAADAAYAAYAYAAARAAYAVDAYAAARAAYAADAADAYAASDKTLKICADIVRKHYPKPPRS